MTPLLIQLKDVCRLTSLCRSRVYELLSEGKFPVPVKLDTRCRWSLKEIEQWVQDRLDERDTRIPG